MKTCIVVDDTGFDRRINVLCAERVGYTVTGVKSGEDALKLCSRQLPDCMLIDMEMTGMNGMELLAKLHEIKEFDKVTVIICTSYDHASFVQQARINGASACITKPITHYKLKDTLDEIEFMRDVMSGSG